jgi:PKD domain
LASPYILTNADLQFLNCSGQQFKVYVAFLNPVNITTTWTSLNQDAQGNWMPPPNYDTCANRIQPYAPTANLGPNRIGFAGEPLYFDGTCSSARMDVPVASYHWSFTGSPTITYYNNGSQLSANWTAPGLYTVSLTVKDAAGTPTTGVRQVMIYKDRYNTLPGLISVSGLSGSLSSGGWQFQLTTVNSQLTMLNPGSLSVGQYLPIVLLCETSYEVTPGAWVSRTVGPHGLFNPGYPYIDPRILFDGYVQNGSTHIDIDKGTFSCTCAGPQMILQEAKSAMLGYYNCTYTGFTNNIPKGLNTSPAGQGFQVGGLTPADVVHSLLQYHCNIGNFHDLHIWNPTIPTNPYNTSANVAYYFQVYTTLSVNEGTIWSCLGDLTTNDFSQIYCERDGSIRCGPQINYRGQDYWAQPTLLGGTAAPYLINLVQDLGYTTPGTPSTIASNLPTLPALPMNIVFVHPWGNQQNPPQFLQSFGQTNTQIQSTQASLNGPPILCAFSDVPIYDQSAESPDPNIIFPWINANWPQDLTLYPIAFDITSNYTGRASLVKLIATLYGNTTLWSSWYPQSAFTPTGDGTVSIVQSNLPASDWVVDQSHVLPDIVSQQNKQLVWQYWWEIAKRYYYARNISYQGSITTGIATFASLGDIVSVTCQTNTVGPNFTQKLFCITGIDHSIDFTARTWQTTFTVTEVTSTNVGSLSVPIGSPPSA